MRPARLALALILAFPLAAAAQVPKHVLKPEPLWHAFAAVFDSKDEVLLEGKIVRADWLEPGSVLWVLGAPKDRGEESLWRVDVGAASLYKLEDRRRLEPSVRVAVRGYNAREKSCTITCRMHGRDITLEGGQAIFRPTGTGVCSLDELLKDTCPAGQRPGPPPVIG